MKMHYEINEFKTLKYITAYPDGYSKGKKYPIIFFCTVREQGIF